MLKHLIVLLDDTSVPFCNADNPYITNKLISIEDLKAAIQYGMEENLFFHFVYPDYCLPEEYLSVIDTVHSFKIVSGKNKELGDIVVYDGWDMIDKDFISQKNIILRTKKTDLFSNYKSILDLLHAVNRLNVFITDIDKFDDYDFEKYKKILNILQPDIEKSYISDNPLQLNIVTDRMTLSAPNHCNAGVESITVAPNGNFYICPAFYYSNSNDSVGDVYSGPNILNSQLYQLSQAPLCRECDAYHCKRCVWLNKKTTNEVNIPSHEQCVVSHLERFSSGELLQKLKEKGILLSSPNIPILNYTDPFYKKHNNKSTKN